MGGKVRGKIRPCGEHTSERKYGKPKKGREIPTSGEKATLGRQTPTSGQKSPLERETPTSGQKAPLGRETRVRMRTPMGSRDIVTSCQGSGDVTSGSSTSLHLKGDFVHAYILL